MINADQALTKVLSMHFHSILDVGSGGGHAQIFRDNNKDVTTLNLFDADIVGDFNSLWTLGKFDCLWVSHVLEHQPNPHFFLKKCLHHLNDDGILAITVPPLKHEIVGGHLTLWNAGLLLYHLIIAGVDCSLACVKTYGYNVSVIVRKRIISLPALKWDFGDIESLQRFFPFPVVNGFNGQVDEVNW